MRLITRIFFILFFAFFAATFAFALLKKGLRNYENHSTERLTELFTKNTTYDILFIGSSRTHTTINPRIIDSILNVHSYNAGVNGGNLLEFKMTLDAYLVNHPVPKYLILTIDLGSFDLKRPFFNYTQYFDFVNNIVIDTTLSKNGHNTFIQKIIPFVGITDYDDYSKDNAIKGLLHIGEKEIPAGEFQYKGYLSNTQNSISKILDTSTTRTIAHLSDTASTYLNEIIFTCKQKGIHLIFTYAPEYRLGLQQHVINAAQILNYIAQTAAKNNILYYRDDTLAIDNNPQLFANPGHVNTLGATVYSTLFANRMKIFLYPAPIDCDQISP